MERPKRPPNGWGEVELDSYTEGDQIIMRATFIPGTLWFAARDGLVQLAREGKIVKLKFEESPDD